jgi:enoyl-CoA hydratase/carnithine racemase
VVGQQRALELMYTAADVRGDEALRIGLADRIALADEVRSAAHSFASEIAASAPLALLAIRETMRGDLADRVRAATARENQEQQRLRGTDDFAEGVAAVAERRPPNFTGR